MEIVNALTVDVGEYFQDFSFAEQVPRTSWDVLPSRVEQNVEQVLALFADHDARATFFALGWIAERHPQLIRRIVDCGHELGSCGYEHVRATDQAWGQLLADARLAKAILEDIAGVAVAGYRAPGLWFARINPWAFFECIGEAGYRYSSSVYPIGRTRGHASAAPRFANEVRPGLLEVPVATVGALRTNWPAGGGRAFRFLPYRFSRWSIRHINAADRQPAMFRFDAWEIDFEQPRIEGGSHLATMGHYHNLRKTDPRLRRLLRDFRWNRADRLYLRDPD